MGRLDKLPPYLFSAIDVAKRKALDAGVEVVDLGIGDPDLPTPAYLVEVLAEAAARPANHRYPSQYGGGELRQAVATYLKRRFGVEANPDTEILILIGSKEGLGHLPLAFVQEGDNTLVPDIGYPVYGQATILAGGVPRNFALKEERAFLPDPQELTDLADDRTRLVFLNYPHNPSGATASDSFWRQIVDQIRESGTVLVNDAAYLEVFNTGQRPVSLLQCSDLKTDRVIELFSLSKMFNMTGWRVGFAVGHRDVIRDLGRVKESMDSGVFTAVQTAAAAALGERCDALLEEVMSVYPGRRSIIVGALESAGVEVFDSGATFYVWAKVPAGRTSLEFCADALQECGVVITPGTGFGPGGEGWFRISLTAGEDDLREGARRLGAWL